MNYYQISGPNPLVSTLVLLEHLKIMTAVAWAIDRLSCRSKSTLCASQGSSWFCCHEIMAAVSWARSRLICRMGAALFTDNYRICRGGLKIVTAVPGASSDLTRSNSAATAINNWRIGLNRTNMRRFGMLVSMLPLATHQNNAQNNSRNNN